MREGLRLAALASAFVACASPDSGSIHHTLSGTSPLVPIFERVGADTQVPPELLAALAHVETRMQLVASADHGRPAAGLYALPPDELARGAQLAGVSDLAARTDADASIRVAAALLRDAAADARTVDDYLAALAPDLAASVTTVLARGVDGRDAEGRSVRIAAGAVVHPTESTIVQGLGYERAEFIAASSANYQVASRGLADIDHVVIHTMEGSFDGTIGWFQNPKAEVSAHYLARSSDGHIVQMVAEKNIAWHDKCFNTHTIGIEHEGFVAAPERWYTEPMYVESAKLTAYLCDKYNIPKEYGSIIGHDAAPDCSDHQDPGAGWDWDHYIMLVRTGGGTFATGGVTVDAPATLRAGEHATVTVTVANTGNTSWDLDLTRLGTTQPRDRESAFFVDGAWLSPNRPAAVGERVAPGATGTFSFAIVAPDVDATTHFDETFALVEEGVTWFGGDIHVELDVTPRDGGCDVGGGSGGAACALVALGAALRRRRR